MGFFKNLFVYWRTYIVVLTPVLFLPIPLFLTIDDGDPKTDSQKMVNCLYVAVVMAIYWSTEVIPLTATALLPLFLFPLLQVMTAKDTANTYVTVSARWSSLLVTYKVP